MPKMSRKELDAWLIPNIARLLVDLETFDHEEKAMIYAFIHSLYEMKDLYEMDMDDEE